MSIEPLDRRLISALKHDGRMSHTELAARIGTSEGTVRNRLRRLVSEGTIRILPIVDATKLGYRLNVWIGVKCQPGTLGEVARGLSEFRPIRYVCACSGAYDVIAEAVFLSETEMFSFLEQDVVKVDGIASMDSSVVLQLTKLGYEWELREEEGGGDDSSGGSSGHG